MIKDGWLSSETQLKIEFLPPHNGSKKMHGKITEEDINDIMDLHMSSHSTLVPEGPCCVFYATRFQVYWCLTINVVLC